MTDSTRRLAAFCSSLSYADLEADVRADAAHALADTVGCMIAGVDAPAGSRMRAYLDALGGIGRATLVGSSTGTLGHLAALGNGTFGHALDADDGHRRASAHPGVAVVPAAIAVAERRHKNGRELLAAVAAGYEAVCTVAGAVQPSHRDRGFHATATCGCFGAAAAAANLLDLDLEATTHALGLAGTQAGGLFEFLADGSAAKRFHAGRAAMAGVLAGELADSGFDGPRAIIEGTNGFARAFADAAELSGFESLGDPFEITRTYLKPYPCCRHIHGPIDAALRLREEVGPGTIESIRVETYRAAAHHDKTAVRTLLDAQLSIPYGVALAFVTGAATLDGFNPPDTEGPVADLAATIDVVRTDEMDARYPETRPCRVIVEADAGSYAETIDYPLGAPENPMSEAQLRRKFEVMTEARLTETERSDLFDGLVEVTDLDDVDDLTARL